MRSPAKFCFTTGKSLPYTTKMALHVLARNLYGINTYLFKYNSNITYMKLTRLSHKIALNFITFTE